MEDGAGEIVLEANDRFVAINGAARDRVGSFWVVQGAQLVRVIDSGFPNDVPPDLEFLEPYFSAIIDAGGQTCPTGSPTLENSYHSVASAIDHYEEDSKRLGVSIP